MKIRNYSIFLLSLVILLWLFAYIGPVSSLTDGFSNAIRSDGMGYYAWTQFFMGGDDLCFGIIRERYEIYSPQNSWVIKPVDGSNCFMPIYPFGLGVLLVPFYLIALLLTTFIPDLSMDPLGIQFQILISFSGVVFILIGLYFFKKIFDIIFRNTPKYRSFLITLSILLGSNLLHYATYDGIFSHASSFMINSIIFFLYLAFITDHNLSKNSYFFLGFLPIFGATIRLTNITFGVISIFLIFTLVKNSMRKELLITLLGISVGFIPFFFQLLFWKIATGDFFYFTYYDYEGFEFNYQVIPKIIFSFNPHGILPWSPILILSILGTFKAFKFNPSLFIISLVIFTTNTLIFSSWSQPFGGGAFGNRLYIDLYPLLYISIVFAYSYSNIFLKSFVITFSVISIILTLHLTLQYWRGKIDFGGISWTEYYFQISFLFKFLNAYLLLQ